MKKFVAVVLALVMVLGLATTAFAATSGTSLDAALKETTKTTVMQDLAPQVDAAKTFGTYGLLVTDVVTKTVTSEGPFVKMPSDKNATKFYVNGTEIVYLAPVVSALNWQDKAVAVKVGANVAAYAKCEEAYAAAPGTFYLFEDEYYEEVAYGSHTKVFNVDGMVVYAAKTQAVTVAPHAYKVDLVKSNAANAVAGKAVSKVYCSACGEVYDFVDGTVAQAVAKFGAGNYTDTKLTGVLGTIYVGDGVVVAPSVDGEKVESAETFDAGIAMYVGMSVMAAAGSAVVLKKKD